MFTSKIFQTACAVLGLLAACPLAAAQSAVTSPLAASANEDKLSLVPQSLPLPPELLLGSPDMPRAPWELSLRGTLQLQPPDNGPFSSLNGLGRIIDFQDIEGPLGTLTAARFQWLAGDGIGQWTPFVSVVEDVDEMDAHPRDGIGGGFTYRFSKDLRLDIEADYLGGSGDANPQLSSEARVSVILSFSF